jgi:hypothetical protein
MQREDIDKSQKTTIEHLAILTENNSAKFAWMRRLERRKLKTKFWYAPLPLIIISAQTVLIISWALARQKVYCSLYVCQALNIYFTKTTAHRRQLRRKV